MTSFIPATPSPMPRSQRLAAAAAALTAGLGSLGALLLAFDGASPARWAQPTAELAQGIADCDQEHARATRDRCKQFLAQAALTRTPTVTILAKR